MPNPSEQNKDEVHEGTQTLQEIADEVETEREQAGAAFSLPDDDADEDDARTREDHEDGPAAALKVDEVPPAAFVRPSQPGGLAP